MLLRHFSFSGKCGTERHVRSGSKPEILAASKCFPLYPQDRTSLNAVGMSVSCQQRPKQAKEQARPIWRATDPLPAVNDPSQPNMVLLPNCNCGSLRSFTYGVD